MIRSFHPRGRPEEVYPQLVEAGLFTPERIERWEVQRECLCGCGKNVQPLKKKLDGTPRPERGYNFFTNHCWSRVASRYGLRGPHLNLLQGKDRSDPRYALSHQRGLEEKLVSYDDSRFYVIMIEADCHDRGITYKDWAIEAGLPHDWTNSVRRKVAAGTAITKVTAAMILKILGESLPAELEHVLVNSKRPYAAIVREYKRKESDHPCIDEVVIERLFKREPVEATREERREAVRRLRDQGMGTGEIAQRMGLEHNQVERCLVTLARREGTMAA